MAKPDSNGIGSPDFYKVMEELDDAMHYKEAKEMKEMRRMMTKRHKQKKKKNPDLTKACIDHMRETVQRRLAQLLLAHFHLLRVLVDEARKLPGGLKEKEHRRLWVLLQGQPEIIGLHPEGDIFTCLTQLLRCASTDNLVERICDEHEELYPLLQVHDSKTEVTPHFYCVLDEVQITISPKFGRRGEFMSHDNETKRYIFREIWRSWSAYLRICVLWSRERESNLRPSKTCWYHLTSSRTRMAL